MTHDIELVHALDILKDVAVLSWVLVPGNPTSFQYPPLLCRCMFTFMYINLISRDDFKLFQVEVKTVSKCDHTHSTRVPATFAMKHRCKSTKFKVLRDRGHQDVVSTTMLSRAGKQCVAVRSAFCVCLTN